ncbi:hypothetical protein FBZ87_104495 [Nitrospirillum amazonense]|uniref:Uncharacterized protein n=1 Tax=Nitrospirillum amazonense TaxID=28077 RepID=A0A560JXD6_9PROT|nr:hypothetical protein [Nitrospirillum amazonense]TWB75389.1 hypothetical protein FBZ87_104495 [Nitrospirillum amazonense]
MTDAAIAQWQTLARDATRLSDAKFLQIYALLEQLGDKPGIAGAFDAMRPRLTQLRPPRRPTVSRLFFRPAEDLFDDPGVYTRRLQRVSRGTLPTAWKLVRARLDGGMVDGVAQGILKADPRDPRVMARVAAPLWEAGAQALAAIADEAENNLRFMVDNFGRDDDVLRQIQTLRDVLLLGGVIEDLKQRLPERPIGDLAESHVEAIKGVMAQLGGAESPQAAAPVLLVLTARMLRPGVVLKMLTDMRVTGNSQAQRDALTRDLSGVVVGNLLRQTGTMAKAPEPTPGAAPPSKDPVQQLGSLAAVAERLTDGLTSVNDSVAILRDKKIVDRVAAARSEIGEFVLTTVLGNVEKTLAGLMYSAGGVSTPPDEMKKAEATVLALKRSAKLAGHLGIQREVAAKITEIRREIERQADRMMAAPGARGDPEVRRQMFNNLRLVEILAGSDEAERMYREWNRRLT